MENCVFCPDNWDNLDIVERHYDLGKERRLIINPLDPVTQGHVLVIGAYHVESAAQDRYQAAELMQLAAAYVEGKGIQANIITSIGEWATQTVKHTHVHIVPRHKGDGLPLPWTPQHEVQA